MKHPSNFNLPQLYKNIPMGLCHVDTDLRFVEINEWLAALNAVPVAEYLGRTFGEMFPAIAGQIEPSLRQVIETGEPICNELIESETLAQPGVKKTFKHNYVPVQSEDGAVVGVSCVVEDITELMEMPMVLQTLVEKVGMGITVWDKDLRLIEGNALAEQMLQFPEGTFVPGVPMEHLFRVLAERGEYGEGDIEEQVRQRVDLARRFEPHTIERKCLDGTVLEIHGAPMPHGGFVSTHFDITTRRRVEEELQARAIQQEAVARLGQRALASREIPGLMNEAVTLVRETLQVPLCKVLELLPGGKTFSLQAGVGWKEGYVGHGIVGAGLDSQAGYTLQKENPLIVDDLRTETRFTGPPLLHDHGMVSGVSVIIHGKEQPFGVLGAHTTTHRVFSQDDVYFLQSVANVLAEAIQREESDARYRSLVEHAPVCIHEISLEGKILSMNVAGLAMMGVTDECQVKGFQYLEAVVKEDRERIGALLAAALQGESSDFEFASLGEDGEKRIFSSCFIPIRNSDGTIPKLMGITEDITNRKSNERQLEHLSNRLLLSTRSAQLGIWEWDIKNDYLIWDDQMYSLYGIPKKNGQETFATWANSLHWEDRDRAEHEVRLALNGEKEFNTEFRVVWPDKTLHTLEAHGRIERDSDGVPLRMIGVNWDISERKNAEETLRESEERLRIVASLSYDVLWQWNLTTGFHQWFGDIDACLGYEPNEFPRTIDAWEGIIHPEDRDRVLANLDKHHKERTKWHEEYRIVRKDGIVRYWDDRGETRWNDDGVPLVMTGAIMDITERKQAEAQLRELSRKLQRTEEIERKKIARELHDEFGQVLTALKMDLGWLKVEFDRNPSMHQTPYSKKVTAMMTVLNQAIRSVRRVTKLLRPEVLDTLGLLPALEGVAKDFQERTGITCLVVVTSDRQRIILDDEKANALFRITQEFLTNVMRHALASEVQLTIGVQEGKMCLAMIDNGVGFDARQVRSNDSFGLLGMKERAEILGGNCRIVSNPGEGTHVMISLPV